MPLTPNWNIFYRDTSTPASLETESALQADSVDDALTSAISDKRQSYSYRWNNSTERAAQTGMRADDRGYQIDTGVTYRYSGSAWVAWESAWISYTPTLNSITVGSGTVVGFWRYSEGTVVVEGRFTLGSGSTVGSNPSINHPVNASTLNATRFYPLGQLTLLDTGVNAYVGAIHATSATACEFAVYNAASTYNIYQILSASVPFAFGTGDVLMWRYQYQPA